MANKNTYIEIENLIKLLREDYKRPGNSDQFNSDLWDTILKLRNLKTYY